MIIGSGEADRHVDFLAKANSDWGDFETPSTESSSMGGEPTRNTS